MNSYAVIYRIFRIRSSVVLVASVMAIRLILMPGLFTVLSFSAVALVNLFILLPVFAAVSIIVHLLVLLLHLVTCSVVLPMFIFLVSTPNRLRTSGPIVVLDIHTMVRLTWAELAMLRFLTVISKGV